MKNRLYILATLIAFCSIPFYAVFAQTEESVEVSSAAVTITEETSVPTLYFFHSYTCPHCIKEGKFLDTLQNKYPELAIQRYEVSSVDSVKKLKVMLKEYSVEHLLGSVPLTFVGEQYFVGYNSDSTTGADIERAVLALFGGDVQIDARKHFDVPFLGRVYADDFSLSALAITLGFLDGFNVCSLGALVLIIGLTLKLQRRKAIVLLGGTFIVTTALVYGGLIVVWARIFEIFDGQLNSIKMLVAFIALGGGIYFLKEYFRMVKQGAVCELQESPLINKLMQRTGKAFEDNTKIVSLLGIVLLFAAVIAIVEFPCSAATPLVFAAVLADAGVSALAQAGYIALFVLFYMLDEIVIFGIAAYRLKLWMTNGKFTKYAVLAEAVILIIIGLMFIVPVLGVIF